jgi:hypothetical protein
MVYLITFRGYHGKLLIQSNPGNATTEIIADGINGFNNDPECNNEIYSIICKALNNKSLIAKAYAFTAYIAKLRLIMLII